MKRFLDFLSFLVSHPDPNFQHTKWAAAFILILFVGSFALRIWRKRTCKDEITKKILRRTPGHLLNYATGFLLLLLFRETGMPYLSIRLWPILLMLLFLIHAFRFTHGFKKEYAQRFARKQGAVNPYLSGKK